MPKIKKLSPDIISKIAAGEVIERPAFAVKELIENAIDAKATQITIEIEESGLKKIVVSDNGTGMKKEDLLESFKPHTTSKLYREEEMHTILSLGFRGEALSSIASISDVTMQSKFKNETKGFKVHLKKGEIVNSSTIGMPVGTRIMIERLFANVPARKKFLKSLPTEFRHILDIVSNFALCYPDIEFTLIHNNKTYFSFTKHDTLEGRIQSLLGDSLWVNLIPIEAEDSYIKISGYLARPQYSIKGQSKLFLFVNGRRVYDNLIANAVKDAYKNLLEYGAYPIALLYITLPPETVDVNIHPRKQEIRFINQEYIYSIVNNFVAKTLQAHNLTFLQVSWKDGGTKTYLAKKLKYELFHDSDRIEENSEILQVHDIYLIAQTKKGIMIIDQHAADEAIRFRKLNILYKEHEKKKKRWVLPTPILLSLSLSDREILVEYQTLFTSLGFELEEFGDTIRINTVPEIMRDRNIHDLIQEIIEDVRIGKPVKDIDTRTHRMLSYLACRSAIKGGQNLSQNERKALLANLQKQDMVYTCPHGRPVKIEMSTSYLHKLFKRN